MKEQTVPTKTDTQVAETREESRTLVPPVDIFEQDQNLVVVVDIPGVDKDGIDIRVEDDVLTIKATPKIGDNKGLLHQEYELRPYFRQFQLGEMMDREKIRADIKHGVLSLVLPKAEAAKPRTIPVSVAG